MCGTVWQPHNWFPQRNSNVCLLELDTKFTCALCVHMIYAMFKDTAMQTGGLSEINHTDSRANIPVKANVQSSRGQRRALTL